MTVNLDKDADQIKQTADKIYDSRKLVSIYFIMIWMNVLHKMLSKVNCQ